MPTLEEYLRKEQDLFGQERQEQQEPLSAFNPPIPTRHEEEEQQKANPPAVDLESPVLPEKLAPHVLAEVPQQGEVPPETLVRLFEHYSEKGDDEEVAPVPPVLAKSDARQLARERVPGQLEADDVIRDGIEADFVQDSVIVGADLDTHRRPDGGADWDGWQARRKRQQDAAASRSENESAPTSAPFEKKEPR
jgi:hypothetical protein